MGDKALHPVLDPKRKHYAPAMPAQPKSHRAGTKPSPKELQAIHLLQQQRQQVLPCTAPGGTRREFRDRPAHISLGIREHEWHRRSHSASFARRFPVVADRSLNEHLPARVGKLDHTVQQSDEGLRGTLSISRMAPSTMKGGSWSRHHETTCALSSASHVQVEPDQSDYAAHYAARAEAFYRQAIERTSSAIDTGMGQLGAAESSHGVPRVDSQRMEAMQSNFSSATCGALDLHKGNFLAASHRASRTLEDQKANVIERVGRHTKRSRLASRRQTFVSGDESLRAEFTTMWNRDRKHACDAFGGLGFHYDVLSGEDAQLTDGWEAQMEEAASTFDHRHHQYSARARRLLSECEVRQRRELELRLFMLRSNRFTVQPLRLDTDQISPRGDMKREACHNFDAPLALSVKRGGGPLIPVYTRKFTSEVYKDEEEDHCVSWLGKDPKPEVNEPEVPEIELIWTLYGSIWGPRCEWCDGLDFLDHDEVVFERFAVDWQMALRLGVARMISDNDDEGKLDEDDDGVPDEVEDVGAVLLKHAQLYTMVYLFYADAVYSGGGDLQTGMKENEGWKALSDNIGICAETLRLNSNASIPCLASRPVLPAPSTYRVPSQGRT